MKRLLVWLLLIALVASPKLAAAASPAPLPEHCPWDAKALSRTPKVEWIDQKSSVHSLYYAGEPYLGKPTRVFAYYASPLTLEIDHPGTDSASTKKYPAVVLVHGGGGTAFKQWVEFYARHGYAAISMDLGGIGPDSKRLADGGPPQDDKTKFELPDLAIKDQWTYHAIADVMLAHSLLRSFPEVDAEKTGVHGISWGGYLTCIAAGVDWRFKAASPMYGCGYLLENSSWVPSNGKAMSPEWKAKWTKYFDPSSYVGSAPMPVFFTNGSNDQFYPLDSYMKTVKLVAAPLVNIRIEPKMRHGHLLNHQETLLFFNQHLKGETSLPVVGPLNVKDGKLAATVAGKTKLVKAELHFTTEPHVGEYKKRTWTTNPLAIDGEKITGDAPPAEATAYYITVTDERGALVSSHVAIR